MTALLPLGFESQIPLSVFLGLFLQTLLLRTVEQVHKDLFLRGRFWPGKEVGIGGDRIDVQTKGGKELELELLVEGSTRAELICIICYRVKAFEVAACVVAKGSSSSSPARPDWPTSTAAAIR